MFSENDCREIILCFLFLNLPTFNYNAINKEFVLTREVKYDT